MEGHISGKLGHGYMTGRILFNKKVPERFPQHLPGGVTQHLEFLAIDSGDPSFGIQLMVTNRGFIIKLLEFFLTLPQRCFGSLALLIGFLQILNPLVQGFQFFN